MTSKLRQLDSAVVKLCADDDEDSSKTTNGNHRQSGLNNNNEHMEAILDRIEEIPTTVAKHNETIEKLTSRIAFVFEFIGLYDESVPPFLPLKAELSEIGTNLQLHGSLHPEVSALTPSMPNQPPPAASV
jgi:type I site-specific restriction endonuclease